MKTYAHVVDGVVREVLSIPDDLVLGKDLYAPEIAKACVACDVTVSQGMLYDADKETFSSAPVPVPAVPTSVSKAQAKIQLLRTPGAESGKTLLDDVTTAVNAAGGEVAIWFSDAQTWERHNPYVAQLGSNLKLTANQIDQMFVAAAQIAA